ncbi:hypothetical protein CYMTET_37408 [Cymbomonas tetramitiformis]|uniref:Uncharacterized protein n=1 Tax=Cymbomonas tetramitiformis TaxID=36881 RepID=A0AAE0CFQ8_9CHLO|nr:hypothetical protein CYMTET_37408 [Cymbomonas tetramitiformis]
MSPSTYPVSRGCFRVRDDDEAEEGRFLMFGDGMPMRSKTTSHRGAIIDYISPDLFETSATVADLLAGANASANADIDVDTITVASEPYREDKNRAIDDDGDDESVEVMTTTTTTEIADAARVAGSVADDIAIIGDDDVEKAENVDDADDDGRGDDDDDDGRGDDDADRVIKFKCKEFVGPVKPVIMHVVLESADGNYIGYVDARGMCLLAEDIKYNGEVSHYIKRHEADIQDLVAANDGLSRDDIIIYLDVPYTNKYRTFMHPLLADRLGASLLRRRVSCPILEKHVRDTVAKSLNGTTEVVADAGRIDVVTDDEIIEVKHVAAWKHAYGQVKSYMTCIGARHYGRIHLFGTKTEIDRRSLLIESTLAELDSTVRVTYEYLSVTDRTPVVREGLKALQSRMREVDEWMEDLLEFTRKVSPSAIEKRAVAIERDDDDDHGGSAERMATSDDGDDESDGNDDDDGDDGDNIDDDDDESDGIARDDDVIGFKCKEFAGPTKTVTMHVVIANTDGTYLGYVDARAEKIYVEKLKTKIVMAEQRLRLRVVEARAESEVEEQRQSRKRLSDLEFDKQRRLANLHLEWAKRDRACKRNSANADDDREGDLEWEAVDDVDAMEVPVVADENAADDDAGNADEEDAIVADDEEEESELEPLPAAEAAWRALYDRRGTAENAKLTSDFAPMLRGTTIRHDRGTKTVKAYMYHKADEPLILSEARAYFNRLVAVCIGGIITEPDLYLITNETRGNHEAAACDLGGIVKKNEPRVNSRHEYGSSPMAIISTR